MKCRGLLAVGLWVMALPAMAFSVGDRVFIPMYSENLLSDGYADGLITQINPDGTVNIRLSDVVNGQDKTLAGTCSPRPGLDIMQPADLAKRRETIEEVPTSKILPWNKGQFQYVERENLSTTIQRWLAGGMAITPDVLKGAERQSRELNLPRIGLLVRMAQLQVDSTGGNGFPVPPRMALKGSAAMLGQVAALVQPHPQAVQDAAAILAKTAPAHSRDLLVEGIVHLAKLTEHQLQKLAEDNPDPRKVDGFPPEALVAIYTGWYQLMTANDTIPYENARVAFFEAQVSKTIAEGKWPSF
ncbi:hypothetical protein [Halothiobacillus sp. DCM-1]|uniref:hypothetical protein n=1 Tax=Halothiobacillus sp. DCM-1 TaxID=3112558 RepID=UPI00324DC250